MGECETSDDGAVQPIRRAINGPLSSATGLRLTVLLPVITKVLTLGTVLLTTAANPLSATELRATTSGTNLVLSWPQDSTNNFYLQVSTSPATPAAWLNATNPTALVGNDYTATIAMTEPQQL